MLVFPLLEATGRRKAAYSGGLVLAPKAAIFENDLIWCLSIAWRNSVLHLTWTNFGSDPSSKKGHSVLVAKLQQLTNIRRVLLL